MQTGDITKTLNLYWILTMFVGVGWVAHGLHWNLGMYPA